MRSIRRGRIAVNRGEESGRERRGEEGRKDGRGQLGSPRATAGQGWREFMSRAERKEMD
jgi:hypothetical protein